MKISVILYNLRSLYNVGSIFRTADAAGVEKIYLVGSTPTPIDIFGKPRPQFVKVSLGAEKNIPWEKISSRSINHLLKNLKQNGYKIFAVEQNKNALLYYRLKLSKLAKIVLILGNETKGLSSTILKKSDKILQIPMFGKKESLNVSVAFGIIVYGILF